MTSAERDLDPGYPRRKNRLKDRLSAGHKPVVVWVSVPWPPLVEILARAGVDGVVIDMQHSSISLSDVEGLISTADACGISAIVRPRSVERLGVSCLLDLGAMGILFPDVRNGAEAAAAHGMMMYPPAGSRDWGGAHTPAVKWRTGSSNARMGLGSVAGGLYSDSFIEYSNANLLTMFLVGSREGVRNIEDIVAHGKPDTVAFAVGQYSVECSFDRSACDEAAQAVYSRCRQMGVGVSLPVPHEKSRPFYPGCYYLGGIDVLIISEAIERAVALPNLAL